jgi:hypothetical protein
MVINGSDELRNISALSLKADFKSDGPCRDVPNHGSHPARYRRHVAREYVLGHPMLVTLADRVRTWQMRQQSHIRAYASSRLQLIELPRRALTMS